MDHDQRQNPYDEVQSAFATPLWRSVRTLFSLRVHALGFMGMLVLSAVVPLWLAWAVWPIVVLGSSLMAYDGEQPLWCPACGMRVEMTYSVCHYCGYDAQSGQVVGLPVE